MAIDYVLLALVFSAGYGLLKYFLPDFPLSEEVFFSLLLYVLAKLGVEIVGKPAFRALFKR